MHNLFIKIEMSTWYYDEGLLCHIFQAIHNHHYHTTIISS